MFILVRLLPTIAGLGTLIAFILQTRDASSYPWTAVIGIVAFAVSGFIIAWSRHRNFGDMRPLLTGLIAVAAAAYGLVLAEGVLASWIIPIFAGGTVFLVCELLFLSLYAPARYPVNGLSHLNLVLVPIALWFAAYASLGLTIFVNVPALIFSEVLKVQTSSVLTFFINSASRLIPAFVLGALSLALFATTSHVEANPATRRRWAFIGGWVGVQVGMLIAFLPLDLVASSTFVSLICAYVLRTRRYGISPPVPRRQIISEALTFVGLIGAILGTARWV